MQKEILFHCCCLLHFINTCGVFWGDGGGQNATSSLLIKFGELLLSSLLLLLPDVNQDQLFSSLLSAILIIIWRRSGTTVKQISTGAIISARVQTAGLFLSVSWGYYLLETEINVIKFGGCKLYAFLPVVVHCWRSLSTGMKVLIGTSAASCRGPRGGDSGSDSA